jgi:hypothetical protein
MVAELRGLMQKELNAVEILIQDVYERKNIGHIDWATLCSLVFVLVGTCSFLFGRDLG